MDALYLLRESKSDEELRWSLRSLAVNGPAVGRVFIFGHLPAWVDTEAVWHYPWEGPRSEDGANDILCKKLLDAMSCPALGEDVLYMCDDFVFLKPVREVPALVLEDMSRHYRGGEINNWQKMLWKTFDYCRAFGFPGWNFETHTPKVLNKARFVDMMEKFRPGWENARHMCDGINYETAYFNMFPPERIEYAQARRVGILKPLAEKEVYEATMRPFDMLFYNDEAAADGLLFEALEDLFPVKSRFEM